MLQRTIAAILLTILIICLGGCGGSEEGPASEVRVEISDFSFKPETATIKAGGEIIWSNLDAATHQLEFENYEFEGQEIRGGMELAHEFETAGKYPYKCKLHADNTEETGTIIVK